MFIRIYERARRLNTFVNTSIRASTDPKSVQITMVVTVVTQEMFLQHSAKNRTNSVGSAAGMARDKSAVAQRLCDYGGNESIYQTLHKRRKTEKEELLQTISTALISKTLLTLQSLFNWKWTQHNKISVKLRGHVRSYSQPISVPLPSGPAWLSFDSVTDSGEGKGRCMSCHMGFHFFSLHHIYGSPDAPIHCKWQVFIWCTQVMEAIRQSPLSYKCLWPPRDYIIQVQTGHTCTVTVKANIPVCSHRI